MRRSLAVVAFLGWAFASQPHAQGLFDDTEARRRIDAPRQQRDANQRAVDERLTKIEAAATDRGGMLELSSQINALRDEIARMRGQLELLANQADNADKRQKDLYLDIDTRLRKLEQASERIATEKPAATADAEASP